MDKVSPQRGRPPGPPEELRSHRPVNFLTEKEDEKVLSSARNEDKSVSA